MHLLGLQHGLVVHPRHHHLVIRRHHSCRHHSCRHHLRCRPSCRQLRHRRKIRHRWLPFLVLQQVRQLAQPLNFLPCQSLQKLEFHKFHVTLQPRCHEIIL